MTSLLIGVIIGLIIGTFIGAFITANFDVINTEYNIDHLKAKKGAVINVKQENAEPDTKPKRNIFKFLKRKNK